MLGMPNQDEDRFQIDFTQFLVTVGAMKAIFTDVWDIDTRASDRNKVRGVWKMTSAHPRGFHISAGGRSFGYEWPHGVVFDERTGIASLSLDRTRVAPPWTQEIKELITSPGSEVQRRAFLLAETSEQRAILANFGLTEHEIDLHFARYVEAIEAITVMNSYESAA